MINIKPNDYVKPTAIRENVVQDICDAFLNNCVWSTCHLCRDPHSRNGARSRDGYVLKRKNEKAYGFYAHPSDSDVESSFYNENEMREAFRILIANGYHMFLVYSYGYWAGYVCSCRDYYNGGIEVKDFTEHWD